jgi:hypothetical protein
MSKHPMVVRSRLICSFFAICVLLLLPLRANAWGEYGHRIVARIAAEYLSPKARERIVELLRVDAKAARAYYQEHCPAVLVLSDKATLSDNERGRLLREGLACIAPWPDPPLKFVRTYTSNWHFVDIPVTLNPISGHKVYSYEVSRDCRMDEERGDCAVLALSRLRPVLANAKQTDDDYREQANARAEALKFIVHIIGDLHQPLHTITDKNDPNDPEDQGDIGGNNKKVKWLGADFNPRWNEQWNLHSVWDEGIIDEIIRVEKLGNTEEQYTAKLIQTLRGLKPEAIQEIQSGSLLEWIHESYQLAVERAYGNIHGYYNKDYEWKTKNGLKRKGGYILPQAYYDANHGIVDEQLQNGGVRLARYLNDTFDK